MEVMYLKEALFAGMTANGYKLGTVLALGWFWVRVGRCTALYRGDSMEKIDFANVLAVVDVDAEQISPPDYLSHEAGSMYFYVVRRFNNCGEQERTLSASVGVRIDADGGLIRPQPNGVFEWWAEQRSGSRLKLLWFYWPIKQESAPVRFNVYYDNGTGQIDYGNSVAEISYAGAGFYGYESDALEAGTYLFAIRAEDTAGTENSTAAYLPMQLCGGTVPAAEVLSVEGI